MERTLVRRGLGLGLGLLPGFPVVFWRGYLLLASGCHAGVVGIVLGALSGQGGGGAPNQAPSVVLVKHERLSGDIVSLDLVVGDDRKEMLRIDAEWRLASHAAQQDQGDGGDCVAYCRANITASSGGVNDTIELSGGPLRSRHTCLPCGAWESLRPAKWTSSPAPGVLERATCGLALVHVGRP